MGANGTCRSRPFAYAGKYRDFVIPDLVGGQPQADSMHKNFQPTVYILVSRKYGTNYTGVTSNLMQRLQQHREESLKGFSNKYGVKKLVWYEQHATMETAIRREKQIKKWNRQWKINMIEETNPEWRDLGVDLGFPPLWQ